MGCVVLKIETFCNEISFWNQHCVLHGEDFEPADTVEMIFFPQFNQQHYISYLQFSIILVAFQPTNSL